MRGLALVVLVFVTASRPDYPRQRLITANSQLKTVMKPLNLAGDGTDHRRTGTGSTGTGSTVCHMTVTLANSDC